MKTIKVILIIFFTGILISGCKEKKEIEIVPDLETTYLPSSQVDVPIKEGKDFKAVEEKDLVDAFKSLNKKPMKDSLLYNIALRLFINENGTIDKIKDIFSVIVTQKPQGSTANSSTEERYILDKALANYMNDWKFIPAIKDGKNVKSWIEYTRGFFLRPDGSYKIFSFTYPPIMHPPDMNAFVPVDKMPQVINTIPPHYPELAKRAGIEGSAYVKILIDTEGKPLKAVVIKTDNEIFNQPSIDAAMQFKFTPAEKDNKPVAVWVVIPFRYKLDGSRGELMHYKDLKDMPPKK